MTNLTPFFEQIILSLLLTTILSFVGYKYFKTTTMKIVLYIMLTIFLLCIGLILFILLIYLYGVIWGHPSELLQGIYPFQ